MSPRLYPPPAEKVGAQENPHTTRRAHPRGTDGSNPPPPRGRSVSLPELLSRVENPALCAAARRWLGDRVGRDTQDVTRSRQPAAISLSHHIPVPQLPLM